MTLMTIGYEGLDILAFIAELKAHNVSTLIDVRELPLSRKKGFSKTALMEAAEQAGIAYLHMSALGCPREIRKDYYSDGDWGHYKKRFNAYLRMQDEALATLQTTATRNTCCLVCFEADFNFCHRSLITDLLARDGKMTIQHLRARSRVPSAGRELAVA